MKQANKTYLLGFLAAVVLFSLIWKLDVLEAVSSQLILRQLPQEMRLGIDLGILPFPESRPTWLDKPMPRRVFGQTLKQVLVTLGAPLRVDPRAMESMGLLPLSPGGNLSRRQAVEALCRTVIFLADQQMATLDGGAKASFADFRPLPKYAPSLGYLKDRQIVRGLPSGALLGGRTLTHREGYCLLFRLYQTVAAERLRPGENGALRFIDLPVDHPVTENVGRLQAAGAFSTLFMRPVFDGHAGMTCDEAIKIIGGLRSQAGLTQDPAKLAALSGHAPAKPLLRRHLAALVDHLLTDYPLPAGTPPVTYIDVPAATTESDMLARLAAKGLRLGYPNGRLAGDEVVTWFEGVGILAEALKRLPTCPAERKADQPLLKSDFQEYTALIQAKRDRIRKILDHKPLRRRT